MLKSEICELLDIKYPIFQGGMAWIADGKLTAAVSEGGGLGIIAAGNAPADYVREQIQIARSLTNKPIGVNIMLLSPFAEEVAEAVCEEKVEVVTTGAGNPSKYMKRWTQAGIKVIPVVASAAMAKLVSRMGASAVIAEGGESGGHVGELTTMVLVPQVCDASVECNPIYPCAHATMTFKVPKALPQTKNDILIQIINIIIVPRIHKTYLINDTFVLQ